MDALLLLQTYFLANTAFRLAFKRIFIDAGCTFSDKADFIYPVDAATDSCVEIVGHTSTTDRNQH